MIHGLKRRCCCGENMRRTKANVCMLVLTTHLVNCSINFHWNDKISVVDRLWTQQRKGSEDVEGEATVDP